MGNERLKGKLLIEHREKHGYSYRQMAKLMRVSENTLRMMELGHVPVYRRDTVLEQVASALGCSVGALLTRAKVA